jgi:hypothetical protein
VVAIDAKPDAVGALWHAAVAAHADILPLVVDFARPTPAAGWQCREHLSFPDRADAFFDCAFLLDTMHHFMVADQIPPDQLLEAVATLTTRWLLVEYVGPGDPAFHRLARGRDALYKDYNRAEFDRYARRSFDIVTTVEVPQADRAFCLLRRKS